MSWEQAEESTKNAGTGGDFFKLEDGQSGVIAIYGEPHVYTAKPFEGRPDSKPSQKVMLRVLNVTTKQPQIWDMAGATFKGLLEVTGTPTKPGKFPVSKWTFTVKRSGTSKKTRYTILPDTELTEQRKKFLAGLDTAGLAELADRVGQQEDDERGGDFSESARAPAAAAAPAAAGALPSVEDDDLPF